MLITYLIGWITVICLQKENFGSMKMQAALIPFLAALLAMTWAQPFVEDLPELESGLTKSGYPAQPTTITENVDALKDRFIYGYPGAYEHRCRRCKCRCVGCTADVCN